MRKLSNLVTLPFRYIEYIFNQIHPLWCTFAITENCNARCEYCQYWRKRHSELSIEDVFKIIRQLKTLGVVSVVFSGGECMLRPDLPEVIAYTTSLGLEASVVSNGLISSEDLFREMMSHGLSGLTFSLDGSEASIHETFRKGCTFDNVVQSIKMALEIRKSERFTTKISTTTVVNKTNIDDLQNIYRLRKSMGADKNYFQPVWPIFNEKRFHKRFGFSEMSFKDLQKVAAELMHIPKGNLKKYYRLFPYMYRDFGWISKRYQCYAGRAFIYVDSSGNLFPCSPLSNRQPMGSLLKDNIKTITSKQRVKDKLMDYKQFKCGGCTLACYMEKNIVLSGLHNPLSAWKRIN